MLKHFLAYGTMLAKSHSGQYLRNHIYVDEINRGEKIYEIIQIRSFINAFNFAAHDGNRERSDES